MAALRNENVDEVLHYKQTNLQILQRMQPRPVHTMRAVRKVLFFSNCQEPEPIFKNLEEIPLVL